MNKRKTAESSYSGLASRFLLLKANGRPRPFYTKLAGLQTSREARAQALQQAIDYIEEAIQRYRALGLQAEVATSLNNAASVYQAMADVLGELEAQIEWLVKGRACAEESVETFREQGIIAYLLVALTNAVMCQLKLAERTSRLDRDKVLHLCDAGERLAAQMQDQQRGAFFRDVKRMID